MAKRSSTFLLIASMIISSCGMDSGISASRFGNNEFEAPWYYFTQARKLQVEVVYEPGAEPYAGTTPQNSRQLWTILEDNLKELFKNRSQMSMIQVPHSIAEMRQIAKQSKTDWTEEEIYQLAEEVRLNRSSADEAHFIVLYLRGYFNSDGATQSKVLGVSLGGTTVIAMFKDVIDTSGDVTTQKYVEQSTLVHEMGHAVGLVDNGLPMHTNHHDTAHSTHCTNSNCVMYWQNEGRTNLQKFIDRFREQGTFIMFGKECLDDAHYF